MRVKGEAERKKKKKKKRRKTEGYKHTGPNEKRARELRAGMVLYGNTIEFKRRIR
jgi:hypothetical protein